MRVGGRSKEDKLKDYNLRELKYNLRQSEFKDRKIAHERGRLWAQSKDLERYNHLNESSKILKESYKGVLSLGVLERCMLQRHYQHFKSRNAQNHGKKPDGDANLLDWLHIKRKKEYDEIRKEDKRNHERWSRNEDVRKITDQRVYEDEEEFSDESEVEEEELKCKVICYPQEVQEDSADLYNRLNGDCHMEKYREDRVYNLFSLSLKEKWELYRLWRSRLQRHCQGNIYNCQDAEYEDVLQKLHEVDRDEDLDVLSKAKVIGMTTTCAAKNRDLLQRIQPKIVIIEEAAEVLEAHILTSIPMNCEHVILIGDHQQLRPNCNVYKLAKEYNLSISMFERLIKQGLPCERLSVSL